MTKQEELINWFNNIFYNCYYVKHDDYPNSIYMFYDLNYIRKIKLAKISGKECLPSKTISGECLFEQDWENKYLWCKYSVIWKYLEDNYSSYYNNIQQFVKDRLEEHTKMNVLTPKVHYHSLHLLLEEHTKMNVLTPYGYTWGASLEEHTKMNVLTPVKDHFPIADTLEEHIKMNVLTPHVHSMATYLLEEHSKMTILTPTQKNFTKEIVLEEHTKMTVLINNKNLNDD